uniref:Amino acid transporter transmembrane domain-containing protein n=1 Tax=Arion vulgaris TaxID=1028688 RepID=A0A0B7ARU4_9EUPU
MGASHNWPFIINLGNSIIGVALLAMPFCFQKCGILLSMLILVFCTWLTLISCQLLMKAGITSRRRSYEFLAYYTHGATGKFISEVGMIGFQLGTLIAQIVVIGDLGPSIVKKIFGIENIPGLRTALMILLCMTIGLPMALIKDIRAISRVSTVCVAFYSSFVLYVFWLAIPNLWSGAWYQKVYFWKPQGLFQSLPILSFSFGCQTQLFLIYDALPEPSFKAMSKVVNCAVNLCAVAYLMVGFCGYIAFYTYDIPGDVISIFPNTFFTDLMKVCFVVSIVITFPVIVFPCRASIYTLLYAKRSKARDDVIDLETYIPAKQLKIITVSLVVGSLIIGILIPNVEFILGMNGAIMGTLICYIFPALFFLKVMGNKPEGRSLAQFVLLLGVTILLVSTYATLRSQEEGKTHAEELLPIAPKPLNPGIESVLTQKPFNAAENKESVVKISDIRDKKDVNEVIDDRRKEPPNPDPPDTGAKLLENLKPGDRSDTKRESIDDLAKHADSDKIDASNKAKEFELQEKGKKQDEILAELEKQRIEQKNLIEQQKQLLKEFKDHHEQDMKQGAQQQNNVPNQQNPILQQQQEVNTQTQISKQQQNDPQQNGQEILQKQLSQQTNETIILDKSNQQPQIQPKAEEQIANKVNILNSSIVTQRPQDSLNNNNIQQNQHQFIQQQEEIQNKKQPDFVEDQNKQKPNHEQDQSIKQPPELLPHQQQDGVGARKLNEDHLVSQTETQQHQETDHNAGLQNLQPNPQFVDNLNRNKRNVDDQSLIVDHNKVIQNKDNESSSFDKDDQAQMVYSNKSEDNPNENKLVAKDEKQSNGNIQDDGAHDTQEPKTNEEMRRKLKSVELLYTTVSHNKKSVFDSLVPNENVSRTLSDVNEGKEKPSI